MCEEAIAALQKAVSLSGGSTYALARLARAYVLAGREDEARRMLEALQDHAKQKYVSPYDVAAIYVALAEKEQAFAWLETAFKERSHWLTHLKVEPRLDPLRSDPRFHELVLRIGFPA
jgi:hypothetical protein